MVDATTVSIDDYNALKALIPLNTLTEEHFEQLLHKVTIEEAKKGATLFREGESDHQHFYLLEGDIALLSGSREVDVIQSSSKQARFALAHQWPRKFSGRARGKVRFIRVDSQLISDLLMRAQSQSYRIGDADSSDDDGDWMSQVLRSRVFQQIPPSNIQNILKRMEEVTLEAGEVLIRRGELGDYYYIVVRGTCIVTRNGAETDPQLATLGPGDCFGEEALVSGGTRSSTVTMGTDGTLMRLSKDDFAELIRQPLLRSVKMDAAKQLIDEGGCWVDVRSADAYATNHLPGALSLPLQTLRSRCAECSLDIPYVVYGEHFSDCAVGAFLLRERGFDVWVLEDGAVDLDEHPTKPTAAANTAEAPTAQQEQEVERRIQEVQARYHKALFQRVAEVRQLRQMLEAAETDRKRLDQALQQAREENANLRKGAAVSEDHAALEQRISELQKDLDDAQETIQDASTQESIAHWEHLRVQSRLESTVQALADQHEVTRVLQEENEALKQRIAALEGASAS